MYFVVFTTLTFTRQHYNDIRPPFFSLEHLMWTSIHLANVDDSNVPNNALKLGFGPSDESKFPNPILGGPTFWISPHLFWSPLMNR